VRAITPELPVLVNRCGVTAARRRRELSSQIAVAGSIFLLGDLMRGRLSMPAMAF